MGVIEYPSTDFSEELKALKALNYKKKMKLEGGYLYLYLYLFMSSSTVFKDFVELIYS